MDIPSLSRLPPLLTFSSELKVRILRNVYSEELWCNAWCSREILFSWKRWCISCVLCVTDTSLPTSLTSSVFNSLPGGINGGISGSISEGISNGVPTLNLGQNFQYLGQMRPFEPARSQSYSTGTWYILKESSTKRNRKKFLFSSWYLSTCTDPKRRFCWSRCISIDIEFRIF